MTALGRALALGGHVTGWARRLFDAGHDCGSAPVRAAPSAGSLTGRSMADSPPPGHFTPRLQSATTGDVGCFWGRPDWLISTGLFVELNQSIAFSDG